ncbi:MAG: HEAT repeat domain-containing protein [Deltaproteobacteria bacterium]|nr:HEAT repeat domain-containing protein [Deltaproteobacteria bacterium]
MRSAVSNRGPSLAMSVAVAAVAAAALLSPGDGRAALWPDAPDKIKADLASPDVSRRRAAAADLVNVPRKEAIPLVAKALGDSDLEVRLAAIVVAARIRMTEAGDRIIPWLTDPSPALREAACEFFAKLPDPRLVKVLARSLGDTDPRVRLAAVRALGASGSADAVAPLLARLDDSNSKVRLSVARALARLGDKRAVTPLVSKVQDEASEVRQAVVRTLGELGDPKASAALVIALRDQALEVRIEALSALGRLRAADAVASIAPLAIEPSKKAGAADVRRAALAALGRIGTGAAVDAIVKTFGLYEDASPGTGSSPAREAAVSAGAAATPTLLAALEGEGGGAAASPTGGFSAGATTSGASSSASSAAWSLGEIRAPGAGLAIAKAMRRGLVPLPVGLHALASLGDSGQLPVCLEHVAAPDRAVRVEALAATAKLLDPDQPDGRAVEPLLASLDVAQTPEDRAEIAALLGRTGAARVAPVLVGLTAAKDERLRVSAIDALGTLGAPAGGKTLVKLLDDPSATVRLRAAIALGRAGGPDVVHPTIALLSAAQADRLAVALAVGGLLERHGDAQGIAAARDATTTAGTERDLLLVAIGRAKGGVGVGALGALLTSGAGGANDLDGRRTIALALGARVGDAAALPLVVGLAADADPSVRAQAAWSLGAVATSAEMPLATSLLHDPASAVAANAAASLGRIVARHPALTAPKELCAALDDERPYVRANALTALRTIVTAGRADTCDGARERRLLADDPNEVVRAAAARLLARHASAKPEKADAKESDLVTKARAALERCTLGDPSGAVASVCRESSLGAVAPSQAMEAGTGALVVFVAPDDGGAPIPRTAYAIERPDGFLHVGNADRRGAVVELLLGKGALRLRVASPPIGTADSL